MKGRGRAPNHEGTPERLPSGLYRYKGYVHAKLICGPACGTLGEAKRSYRSKVGAILSPPPPESPTVRAYAEDLLERVYRPRVQEGSLSPTTLLLYEQILRLNLRGSEVGKKRLDQVTPADVEAWTRTLTSQERKTDARYFPSRPLTANSKARYVGMLSAIFEYAVVKDRIIAQNPVRAAAKPILAATSFRILSGEEVERLLSLSMTQRVEMIVLLGLHGLGPAEMCGLQRCDFDGVGLNIRRQRQRIGRFGAIVRPILKTRARQEWIPVTTRLRERLMLVDEGWILRTDRGGPLEPANLRRELTLAFKGTEFAGLRPYDLRHTFAQRLLDQGVDVQTAAELMRHSTETLLRKYVRSDRARKLAAISRMDESGS